MQRDTSALGRAGRSMVATVNDATVERTVADALRAAGPVVLAVSGGRDSMALLHAAARVAATQVTTVATFDHGTGSKASEAVALVAHQASAMGLFCVAGRAPAGTPPTEAAWRAARWRFLRDAAAQQGAAVVTAHTEDDQLETIVMRILRHAGARGLAGLGADSDIVRPWLRIRRRIVHSYAAKHDIAYVEDPSNRARTHLRNRVRLDLLPALRRVRPTLDTELLAIAAAASDWRRGVERLVAGTHVVHRGADGVSVAAVDLDQYDGAALAIVWPVLAARAGVTLDRRGTVRLAAFTKAGKVGGSMQLSGGFEVWRSRFSFVIRRTEPSVRSPAR